MLARLTLHPGYGPSESADCLQLSVARLSSIGRVGCPEGDLAASFKVSPLPPRLLKLDERKMYSRLAIDVRFKPFRRLLHFVG
jgi:hypothetical protein